MSTVESRLREQVSMLEEQISQLRTALIGDANVYACLGLSRQMCCAFAVLMRQEIASVECLHVAMEADRSTVDGRIDGHLRHVIAAIRQRLASHGIEIKTRWGIGYSLTSDAKRKVRVLCCIGAQP